MKKKSLILLLLISTLLVDAQPPRKKYFAAGIDLGVSNYKGDLDDNFTVQFLKPAYGFHFLYLFSDHFNLRMTFFKGSVTANDDYQESLALRNRNLSFYSPITEAGFNLIFKPFRKRGNEFSRLTLTPYVFAGVSVFTFKPQVDYLGSTYSLQALGTEGQNLGAPYPRPYSLTNVSIPMGGGLLYRLNYRWDLGLECGFRKTFTDYLDDVSGAYPDLTLLASENPVAAALSNRQLPGTKRSVLRGNDSAKDWYVYTHFSLTYYFYINQKGKNGSNNCVKVRL